jgi:hypothetical protein
MVVHVVFAGAGLERNDLGLRATFPGATRKVGSADQAEQQTLRSDRLVLKSSNHGILRAAAEESAFPLCEAW